MTVHRVCAQGVRPMHNGVKDSPKGNPSPVQAGISRSARSRTGRSFETAIWLTKIIAAFKAGESMTSRQLAERYGVRQRTAQRWLVELARHYPLVRQDNAWRWLS